MFHKVLNFASSLLLKDLSRIAHSCAIKSYQHHLLPMNTFTCEKFPKHNFHSFLLPLSYGNGMWNPNSVFSEMHEHYPALACANNLLHFCCATHNGTLFALSAINITPLYKKRCGKKMRVCMSTSELGNRSHTLRVHVNTQQVRRNAACVCVSMQVPCTPEHSENTLHKQGWPEVGFSFCGFCLPWDLPSAPDMPDMEHSSQTGDPT